MKSHTLSLAVLGVSCLVPMGTQAALSQDNPAAAAGQTVQVHMVITDSKLRMDAEQPPLQLEDLKIDVGKKSATRATQLIPAQGDNAALQLIIMIDDTLDPTVGGNLQELKDFVAGQPASTVIGVAYMSNAGFQMAQEPTADKDQVVKSIRLPRGTTSTMDSPYLSLIALTKGWTQQQVRREVLMITDGIDRLRGESPEPSRAGPNFGAPVYHSMPTISQDADRASEAAQRTNVVFYALYAKGVGRAGRSGWDLQLGLSGLTKIADETGGEVFSLGTSQLVSFTPHLERLQKLMGNQYYLVFAAEGRKKAGFQRVKIKTTAKNSEILAPDNVWVAAVAQ